jgi:hydrogenase maturation protein HypF
MTTRAHVPLRETPDQRAARVRVTGLVQGVGFRPFVHRLAIETRLAGWVRNASSAVEIHVEGDPARIDAFVGALRQRAPVLARIETLEVNAEPLDGLDSFEVVRSAGTADGRLPVSPDVALCEACERELRDPSNRRYRYPFITCTDCGPRFTVIESMPYDRERTSMRAFAQCAECLREYTTPGDRRYHSETNSCAVCGPRLWFEGGDDSRREGEEALAAAAALLRHGGIVAVRGLGGFHLAVDATNDAAVRRLRARKRREAKPLAVMVRTVSEARALATLSKEEEALLTSAARPIVLLAARWPSSADVPCLADPVAPGLRHVGIVLAYTPLHHLLLEAVKRPLVMTSGNASDEPIATGVEEARERLASIADGLLLHDREIVARYDDSVVRAVDGAPLMLRRARGYAPMPLDLPVSSPRPLLAVGPHLKNTFALMQDRRVYPGQHIGDLDTLETIEHFRTAIERYRRLFHIDPEVVVHDLHPGYHSTRLALESGLEVVAAVQHHHAHIAAVLAEFGRTDPVLGVAYDGTGYGDDGRIWGAELLFADLTGYRRLGHLRYAPLPGGDAAARAPWRVALGFASLVPDANHAFETALAGAPPRALDAARQQIERRLNAPLASSMGRLFDAAAAVLGVAHESRYEGEAAMRLEAMAGGRRGIPLPFLITRPASGAWQLDALPLLVELGERVQSGDDVRTLEAAFHDAVAYATLELVRHAGDLTGCRTVALAGGCFQNARLLSSVRRALEDEDYEVLVPRALGVNDGAVSVGQAAVGAAVLAGMTSRVSSVTTR